MAGGGKAREEKASTRSSAPAKASEPRPAPKVTKTGTAVSLAPEAAAKEAKKTADQAGTKPPATKQPVERKNPLAIELK
jgi:hypothetical protein